MSFHCHIYQRGCADVILALATPRSCLCWLSFLAEVVSGKKDSLSTICLAGGSSLGFTPFSRPAQSNVQAREQELYGFDEAHQEHEQEVGTDV